MVDRLIRPLTERCVHWHRLESQRRANRVIADQIQFYNRRRPQQALGTKPHRSVCFLGLTCAETAGLLDHHAVSLARAIQIERDKHRITPPMCTALIRIGAPRGASVATTVPIDELRDRHRLVRHAHPMRLLHGLIHANGVPLALHEFSRPSPLRETLGGHR